MVSPDNSTVWAQGGGTAGRASEARGAGDGAALAILSEGEEAYDNLYDSRDDSKFRVPLEFKSYYLSKRLPEACHPMRQSRNAFYFLGQGRLQYQLQN